MSHPAPVVPPRPWPHRGETTIVIFPAQPPVQLPAYGEVYKVRGHIQIPTDKKWDRRAVVVGVPQDASGRVRIVTRTSDCERKGVHSPVDATLGFDLPGVWGYYRSVEAVLWVPPDVKLIGLLEPSTLNAICKFFGIRKVLS